MKSNPAPLVLVPGFALIGFVANRWDGLVWALAAWLGLIAIGTVVHLIRRASEQPPRGGRRDSALVPRLAPAPAYGFTRAAFEPNPRN